MTPSHYLNQCWYIVNWSVRNKFKWNFDRDLYILIQENAFENVVCEMLYLTLLVLVAYIDHQLTDIPFWKIWSHMAYGFSWDGWFEVLS